MKLLKKYLLSLSIILWMSYAALWICLWGNNDFYYQVEWWVWTDENEMGTDIWLLVKENAVDGNSLLQRTLEIFNLDQKERYTGPKKALAYAKYLLNYAMGFVAFIALCLLIYSFYCVVVWDEKQIEKAKSYLKWIAIAIIVMWLSWLIVSIIFWLYEDVTKNPNTSDTLMALQTFNSLA